jgi:DNA-binding transcriptional LysR family regulator
MNFRHYEAFYWIGRLGSFHAAARHLKTSQPAISTRIRDLEQSLGVSLFDRAERGVRLSAKGNELLRYAAELMALAADVQQRVGTREALSGRVRFGATNIHAWTWLPSLIARVSRNYPGITVEMAIDTSETLQLLMERGQLDIAVLAGPIETPKLTTEQVGRVANVWVASPRLNLPIEPMSARDLAARPIISDRPGTHLHAATMEWFRSEGAEPRQHHSCSLLPTRIHLAVEGLGIALAARSAINRELADGVLELVATVRPAPYLDYFLAYSDISLSPCDRIVVEAARALLAQKPDLDAYYAAAEDRRSRPIDNENDITP